MSRKDFTKGMAAGAAPFEEKYNQLADATERVGAQVNARLDDISDVQKVILDDLSSREKKELYDLNTLVDIKELEPTEKEFLMAVLYTLSNMTEEVTSEQQAYIRSVKRYLEIKSVQTEVDLSCIENIDSKREERAILQTVMEFLFLEHCDHSYWDEYEDVLDYFSVKNSEIRRIEASIDAIYKATGAQGLAEKFGYVAEEDILSLTSVGANIDTEKFENTILKWINKYSGCSCETKSFFMFVDNGKKGFKSHACKKTDLDTFELSLFRQHDSLSLQFSVIDYENNRLAALDSSLNVVKLLDLQTRSSRVLPVDNRINNMVGEKAVLKNNWFIQGDGEEIIIHNIETKRTETIKCERMSKDFDLRKVYCCTVSDDVLYCVLGDFWIYKNGYVYAYDLIKKTTRRLCECSCQPHSIKVYQNQLYILSGISDNDSREIMILSADLCSGASNLDMVASVRKEGKPEYILSEMYWLFTPGKSPYDLLYFSFDNASLLKIGTGCGHGILTNGFLKIGDQVYFEQGEICNKKLYRVSLDTFELTLVE